MTWKVPLFDLEYDVREEAAVVDVLRSKWLTMGECTASFERAFAQHLGGGHVLAVSSGTAALHLAVRAAGIGPGDEVIVPDLTFVATANAVLYEAATPVFADVVAARDMTIDAADAESKITPRTKAIIVVHYAGYPCRMGDLTTLASKHGLAVIEDCAHAPSAKWRGHPVGTIGDFGCFSFFSNKNVATGEGGAIWCRDETTAQRLRLMRSHGMTAQTLDRHKGHSWGYDVTELGYNYRLTEIEAALALVQLGKLADGDAARRAHTIHYRELLCAIPELIVPFAAFERDWEFDGVSSYHIMPVLLPPGTDREAVQGAMRDAGIQTSVHYRPLHTFQAFEGAPGMRGGLERVQALAPRILTLPLWPGMTTEQVEYVCETLETALLAAR